MGQKVKKNLIVESKQMCLRIRAWGNTKWWLIEDNPNSNYFITLRYNFLDLGSELLYNDRGDALD